MTSDHTIQQKIDAAGDVSRPAGAGRSEAGCDYASCSGSADIASRSV